MGQLLIASGSKETAAEDINLLARRQLQNPKVVVATGAEMRNVVNETASALFLDANSVLVLFDPSKGLVEEIAGQLEMLSEKISVILYFTAPHPDVPVLKGAIPVKLEQDKEKRIRERILAVTKAHGKKMTDKAFTLIKERLKDEALWETELAKLIDYVGDKTTVELKDVAAVITDTYEENMIRLFDAIAKRNKKEAMEIFENLIAHGVHILAIHSFLARQIRLLLQAKDSEEPLKGVREFALFSKTYSKLKDGLDLPPLEKKHYFLFQKPFYAFNLSKTSAKFTRRDLLSFLEMLAEFDTRVKTGTRYDRLRLESGLLGA